MTKSRLDALLVERQFVESRQQAQALILAGQVFVAGQRSDKPGKAIPTDAEISIAGERLKYASRGGLKLEAALNAFAINVAGTTCLDLGASTGGFTDCLLQRGAARVVAVDVGCGQLDWKLRNDPRVEVREGINARYLSADDFDGRFDLITIDVSFISLTKVLPAAAALLSEDGMIVALIKPQFEVGKGEVGKGGIVKDPAKHAAVLKAIAEFCASHSLRVVTTIESPILGQHGNREFLARIVAS